MTNTAVRYLLIRACQQNGMEDRAAMHAEVIRAQESPAGGKAKD